MHDTLTFSIAQAAQHSGVGRTAIYEEIRAGRLRARKLGRRTLILAEDLQRWLEALPAMNSGAAR